MLRVGGYLFGNCTSLLKRKCRVDIMVSVWSCLSCSANTVYYHCQAPCLNFACAPATQYTDFSSIGGPGCALLRAVCCCLHAAVLYPGRLRALPAGMVTEGAAGSPVALCSPRQPS